MIYTRPNIVYFSEAGLEAKESALLSPRNNVPFEDDLLVYVYVRSKKNQPAYFVLHSKLTGTKYPIAPFLLLQALQKLRNVERGMLRGLWDVVMYDGLYSLILLEERNVLLEERK